MTWEFQPQQSYHRNVIFFSASIAVLFGAISAQYFIKKCHDSSVYVDGDSWESELAYDIAYTTSVSEIGYGSFASTCISDLDKFDI
eukprot:152508-Ditylum_brightwellii.AAC.1